MRRDRDTGDPQRGGQELTQQDGAGARGRGTLHRTAKGLGTWHRAPPEAHTGHPQARKVTWIGQLLLQLGLRGHTLGFWGVDDQHDRACTAEQTPQLAQDVELLLQKVRG